MLTTSSAPGARTAAPDHAPTAGDEGGASSRCALLDRPRATGAGVAAAPPAAPAPGRLVEADLLRTLAMLSIVVIHAVAWFSLAGPGAAAFYPALNAAMRWGVPLFAGLTGYVLVASQRGRPLPRLAFARARARRIVVPFVAWVAVYLVCALTFTPVDAGSWSDLPGLVWNGRVAGHLYFLPVVLQLSLVFAVLPRTRRGVALLCAVAVPLEVVLLCLRAFAPPLGGRLAWAEGDHAQWLAIWFIGYYAAGAALATWRAEVVGWVRRNSWVVVLPLLTGALIVVDITHSTGDGYGEILRPSMVLDVPAIALAVLAVGLRIPAGSAAAARLELLADRSLGVYLVHPLILTVLGRGMQTDVSPLRLDGALVRTLPGYLLLVAATCALSLVAVGLLSRLPGGRLLAGVPARRRAPERQGSHPPVRARSSRAA